MPERSTRPVLKLVPDPGATRPSSMTEPLEGWRQVTTGPEGRGFCATDTHGVPRIVPPFRFFPRKLVETSSSDKPEPDDE